MRREAALLLVGALLAAAPTRAGEATSCGIDCSTDSTDLLATGTTLWERADPLALASGTPGDPVGELPDD